MVLEFLTKALSLKNGNKLQETNKYLRYTIFYTINVYRPVKKGNEYFLWVQKPESAQTGFDKGLIYDFGIDFLPHHVSF